jgi:flavin reductase (DIM6/NTAB) family NADH-FMN oxidoreductase RutF
MTLSPSEFRKAMGCFATGVTIITIDQQGDHTIFIAEVEHVEVREGDPLLYFRSRYRDIGSREH